MCFFTNHELKTHPTDWWDGIPEVHLSLIHPCSPILTDEWAPVQHDPPASEVPVMSGSPDRVRNILSSGPAIFPVAAAVGVHPTRPPSWQPPLFQPRTDTRTLCCQDPLVIVRPGRTSDRGSGEPASESRAGVACGQVDEARGVNNREREGNTTSTADSTPAGPQNGAPPAPPHSPEVLNADLSPQLGLAIPLETVQLLAGGADSVPLRFGLRSCTPGAYFGDFFFTWVCDERRSDGHAAEG